MEAIVFYVVRYAVEDSKYMIDYSYPYIQYEVVVSKDQTERVDTEYIWRLYKEIWKAEKEINLAIGDEKDSLYIKNDLEIRLSEEYNTLHPFMTGIPVYSIEALEEYRDTITEELNDINKKIEAFKTKPEVTK